jgi:early secretory antigenic target protein ESAT-6
MSAYSVDSDAVLSATVAVRGTIDRVEAETHAMLAQLVSLQTSWTGGAAFAFSSIVDQWRATQRQVEESLGAINTALATAGRQYAEAEQFSASLFR